MIKIEIEIEPVSKGRPRFTRQGHVYTPAKTKNYEKIIKAELMAHRPEILGGACHLDMTFVRSIPKKWNKKKKQQAIDHEIRPVTTPDLDNYEKAVMDAANGVLYKDDSQIVSKNTRKIYGEVPKVIIKIEEIKDKYHGVF